MNRSFIEEQESYQNKSKVKNVERLAQFLKLVFICSQLAFTEFIYVKNSMGTSILKFCKFPIQNFPILY